MKRYVDIDELSSNLPPQVAYDRYGKGFNDCRERVEAVIEELETIDIVQCKDCRKRNKPYECALWYGMIDRQHHFRNHGDEFFCSYGERKDTSDVY